MNASPALTINATAESWPIAGEFVIARGAKREAVVVVARVSDGAVSGRGECVPYARYGETVDGVREAILAMQGALTDRAGLQQQMPAGAARNALDCALWDLEAKRSGHAGGQARRDLLRCNPSPPPTPSASTAPRRWPPRPPQPRAPCRC